MAAALSGRAWLAALPDELAAQQHVLTGLVDRCEVWPEVRLFLVGCSLGRGAGDALSDIDAALGVSDEPGAERVEALWAAAHGALYPWHGLSQVLDHDPANLPPGIESTVAGLDAADLRRAARASAGLLTTVSAAAARRHPAELPAAMAGYVTRALSG